jgi:HlyD family secretion protein
MKIKIPKFLKKKRNIWIIVIFVIIILAGSFLFGGKKNGGAVQIGSATKQNLQQTVLATGQVVSGTDLNLSFQAGGVVRQVLVAEGDNVKQGELLASLDQSNARAVLLTAQGSLAQAQANYDKLVAGSTPQNIKTVQDSVNSAKQDLLNAYNGSINTLNSAHTAMYNAYNIAVSIKNTYFTSQDPTGIAVSGAKDNIYSSMQSTQVLLDTAEKSMDSVDIDKAITRAVFSLNSVYDDINIIRSQCDLGIYYYQVADASKTIIDGQKTTINTTLTSVTTLQQSIASLKLASQKAEDQLSVTIAPPTDADVALAQAQILSAQGQVNAAQATLNNLIVLAPAPGTITRVDIKVGEQATAQKEVMVLQDIGNLHAEADVSEANIAVLRLGQSIDYTFDALGPDRHFTGLVLTIDPASTVVSGVVNYSVKGSLENIPDIKPGMTANMTVMVAKKDNVLAVPSTAVINKNSKQYVRVIDDAKNKTYHEVQVQTGLRADGGLVEIISGISEGQQIVTYIKS